MRTKTDFPKEEIFRSLPVPVALRKMIVPAVVSQLIVLIYNMADTFFVGQTHDAFQVAAVSLTNPVFVMYMAIANLLGIGGSAVISICSARMKRTRRALRPRSAAMRRSPSA